MTLAEQINSAASAAQYGSLTRAQLATLRRFANCHLHAADFGLAPSRLTKKESALLDALLLVRPEMLPN